MFEVGDFVIYGSKGVCQIKKVGPIEMPGVSKDKLYYTLSQVYLKGSTIFTPVDNDKIRIRKILTRQEADVLIDEIQSLEPVWISDDKEREKGFTEALRNGDCKSLCMMIIALISEKKKELQTEKKQRALMKDIFMQQKIFYMENWLLHLVSIKMK